MFDFTAAVPAIGTVLRLDDQAFELVEVEDYRRTDGQMTVLLCWSANCADCGAPFAAKSPLKSSGIARRCPAHAQAGRPVSGRRGRGRKVRVEVIPA